MEDKEPVRQCTRGGACEQREQKVQSCGVQRELDEKPELEESQCGLFRGREKEKQGVGRRGRKTGRGALRLMQMGGCLWWGRLSPDGVCRPGEDLAVSEGD